MQIQAKPLPNVCNGLQLLFQMNTLNKCSGFWTHSISVSLSLSAFTKQKPRPRAKTAQPWSDRPSGGSSEPCRLVASGHRRVQSVFDVPSRELPSAENQNTTLERLISAVVGEGKTDGGFAGVVVVVSSSLSSLIFCTLRRRPVWLWRHGARQGPLNDGTASLTLAWQSTCQWRCVHLLLVRPLCQI